MTDLDVPPVLPKEEPKPLRYRVRPAQQKQQSQMFFALLMLAFLIALAGLAAGFMYGDAYGRKHAQYNNSVLREYYSGQCYTFWETQFKKTVRETLSRTSPNPEQSLRLDEIRGLLIDMQQNIVDLSVQKEEKLKKKAKVVSQGSALSSRLYP